MSIFSLKREITEYTLIQEVNAVKLDMSVNKSIEDGWQPFAQCFVGDDGTCYQTMVKYEPISDH